MCSYIMMIFTFYCFFFFFSSRRRHTRCSRDWSSDVCSSDLALMRIRRNQVRAAEPLDEEAAGGHGPVSGVPARIDLERAFEQLSETSRAVVWLHDVEGYTHEEIAEQMGKTVSFSKSQLARAHARLRQMLDAEGVGR